MGQNASSNPIVGGLANIAGAPKSGGAAGGGLSKAVLTVPTKIGQTAQAFAENPLDTVKGVTGLDAIASQLNAQGLANMAGIDKIAGATRDLQSSVTDMTGQLTSQLNAATSGLTTQMTNMTGALGGQISGLTTQMTNMTGALGGQIAGLSGQITGQMSDMTGALTSQMNSMTGQLGSQMNTMSSGLMNQMNTMTGQMTGTINNMTNQLGNQMTNMTGAMSAGFSEMGSTLRGVSGDIKDTAMATQSMIGSGFSEINNTVRGVSGDIKDTAMATQNMMMSGFNQATNMAAMTGMMTTQQLSQLQGSLLGVVDDMRKEVSANAAAIRDVGAGVGASMGSMSTILIVAAAGVGAVMLLNERGK